MTVALPFSVRGRAGKRLLASRTIMPRGTVLPGKTLVLPSFTNTKISAIYLLVLPISTLPVKCLVTKKALVSFVNPALSPSALCICLLSVLASLLPELAVRVKSCDIGFGG